VAGLFRRITVFAVVATAGAVCASAENPESIHDLVVRVGRARWTYDNSVELVSDPRQAWQARLDLVDSARHHILISTFSWHNDTYGKDFRRYLKEAVRRRKEEGLDVSVRVLADASVFGLFSRAFDELEDEGADVRGFNRSSWGLTPVYDVRMHDKLVISDGKEALIGGRNIADLYFDPQKWWLDLEARVKGPVVDDLQMIFLKSWELTEFNRKAGRFLLPQEKLVKDMRIFWYSGRYPNGKSPLEPFLTTDFFPGRSTPAGSVPVAVLYDNPLLRRRAATTDLVIALAGRAKEHIELMTPFPNLPSDLTDALLGAVERGVKVRLIVNGREAAIRGGPFLTSGYPTLIRLIEGGAEVWAWRANGGLREAIEASGCDPMLMPPIALHGKMVVVDDDISIVHSSNFNIRSTYYNTEAGVFVLDRKFNQDLRGLVEGLIELQDDHLECQNGGESPVIPSVLDLLTVDDVPGMLEELGGKQPFLDAWSVAW
jgi:phosphatidylserine/phosphatidylglycerophosphate/cardiolipin synthase-like enzyme